jgi:hypothetical protein
MAKSKQLAPDKPYRIRIVGYREIEARFIFPSQWNWRLHLDPQRDALTTALERYGILDACVVRRITNSKFELLDGHLRTDLIGTRQPVPCLITDLTEDEARAAITTFDPLSAMAGQDTEKLALNLQWLEKRKDEVAAKVFPDYNFAPLKLPGTEGGGEEGSSKSSSSREVQPITVTRKERREIEKAVNLYIKAHPEAVDESEGYIVAQICKAFSV